jgi:hypothetical protein
MRKLSEADTSIVTVEDHPAACESRRGKSFFGEAGASTAAVPTVSVAVTYRAFDRGPFSFFRRKKAEA